MMAASLQMSLQVKSMDVPTEPHQPTNLKFPKRFFGQKKIVERCFQEVWYTKWPFLHYDEAKDVVYYHTCLLGFKQMKLRANTLI